MSTYRLLLAPLAALTSLTGITRAGDVVLVSGGGAALQNAIATAANGDTLLIGPGSYSGALVVGRPLSLVAEPSGSVTIESLAIRNLTMGQRCAVSGLTIQAPASPSPVTALEISTNIGSIRLQSVHASVPLTGSAAIVTDAIDVVFERCTLIGGASATAWTPGVICTNSKLAFYDSTIEGAHGADATLGVPAPTFPYSGSQAVLATNGSRLFFRGCTLRGGAGGDGTNLDCNPPGPFPPQPGAVGGIGIEVEPFSLAHMIDCVVQGGAGGTGGLGGQCAGGPVWPPASAGLTGSVVSGQAVALPGAHLTLVTAAQVREGQSLALAVTGNVGHAAYLAVSPSPDWRIDLAFGGVFTFGPGAQRVLLGTIPTGGTLTVSLPIAQLPAGVQAELKHLQLAVRNPANGHVQLGSPAALTILDSAF